MRLTVTGSTGRNLLVLKLVTVNTQKPPMLGLIFGQQGTRLFMADHADCRLQIVLIRHLQRTVRPMAAATIGISLPVDVRIVTLKAGLILAVLAVTLLAIEHRMIARILV